MKITINRLIDYLGEYVPDELKKLPNGKYLVLYYDVINDINNIHNYLMIDGDIKTSIVENVYPVSEVIYMHRYSKNNYYAIPYTVETSDFVLFQYILYSAYRDLRDKNLSEEELKLRTDNAFEDIISRYKIIIEDEKKQENTDLIDYDNHILNVRSIDDTNKFINKRLFFSRNDIPYVKTVFNEINKFLYNLTGKYLFGDMIVGLQNTKYSSEFGILPAYSNSNLRYFFFGRVGLSNDTSFEKAFEMAKKGVSNRNIFNETGWFFRKDDDKWHKLVDIADFRINKEKLKNVYEGNNLYVIPKSVPDSFVNSYIAISVQGNENDLPNIKDILPNLEDIIENGDELFKTYPHFKKIKVFFISRAGGSDNYYASSMKGADYLVINNSNNKYCVKDKEEYAYNFIYTIVVPVIIHEIQHKIQRFEKFGYGGSGSMVSIINKVGGDFFGRILFIVEMISDKINNLNKYTKSQILKSLTDNTSMFSLLFNDRISSFDVFDLQRHIMLNKEFHVFLDILVEHNQKDISKLFVALEDSLKTLNEKLNENSNKENRNTNRSVNFEFYRGLLGEIESRDAQYRSQTKYILSDYFFPYSYSDISDRFKIKNDTGMFLNGNLPFSAIETLESGKYIVHFRDGQPLMIIPFLHEVGHIIFDKFIDYKNFKTIEYYYIDSRISDYKSVEEFFCNYFVSYLISDDRILDILNIKEKARIEIDELKIRKENLDSDEINNILSGLIEKGFFKNEDDIIRLVDENTSLLYLAEFENQINHK